MEPPSRPSRTLASGLGVPVEQVLLPKDLVFLEEARPLPAIAVLRLPNGSAHFAVVWSVRFGVAQVMDPAHGRRWLSREKLREELYEHVMSVPARDVAGVGGFRGSDSTLRRRLRDKGVSAETSARLMNEASADESFQSLAALDAAIRCARRRAGPRPSLREGSLRRERHPERVLVRPPRERRSSSSGGPCSCVRERRAFAPAEVALPAAIAAAKGEKPARPLRDLWARLRADGLFAPGVLAATAVASAAAIVFEGLFFRAFLEAPSLLLPLVLFLAVVLILDFSSFTGRAPPRTKARAGFAPRLPAQNPAAFGPLLRKPPHIRHGGAPAQPSPDPEGPEARTTNSPRRGRASPHDGSHPLARTLDGANRARSVRRLNRDSASRPAVSLRARHPRAKPPGRAVPVLSGFSSGARASPRSSGRERAPVRARRLSSSPGREPGVDGIARSSRSRPRSSRSATGSSFSSCSPTCGEMAIRPRPFSSRTGP